jgi:hypothetical protein
MSRRHLANCDNILITNRMISFSIDTNGIFQMPFFSIVVEEILEWIMTDKATLEEEENNKFNIKHEPCSFDERISTYIVIDVAIAHRWT